MEELAVVESEGARSVGRERPERGGAPAPGADKRLRSSLRAASFDEAMALLAPGDDGGPRAPRGGAVVGAPEGALGAEPSDEAAPIKVTASFTVETAETPGVTPAPGCFGQVLPYQGVEILGVERRGDTAHVKGVHKTNFHWGVQSLGRGDAVPSAATLEPEPDSSPWKGYKVYQAMFRDLMPHPGTLAPTQAAYWSRPLTEKHERFHLEDARGWLEANAKTLSELRWEYERFTAEGLEGQVERFGAQVQDDVFNNLYRHMVGTKEAPEQYYERPGEVRAYAHCAPLLSTVAKMILDRGQQLEADARAQAGGGASGAEGAGGVEGPSSSRHEAALEGPVMGALVPRVGPVLDEQRPAGGGDDKTDAKGGGDETDATGKGPAGEVLEPARLVAHTRGHQLTPPPDRPVEGGLMPFATAEITVRARPDAPTDRATLEEVAQPRARGFARALLADAVNKAVRESKSGLPDRERVNQWFDAALAQIGRATEGLDVDAEARREGAVGWTVRLEEPQPWGDVFVNPEARPNLYAKVGGVPVHLAAMMKGELTRVGHGGHPPDAALDLDGVRQIVERGMLAGVYPQVAEGRDHTTVEGAPILAAIRVHAKPWLGRYGLEFRPLKRWLYVGGVPYEAPRGGLVQEGMLEGGGLSVVVAAGRDQYAKEADLDGDGEREGVSTATILAVMRQHPELSLTEAAAVAMNRYSALYKELNQTPGATVVGGQALDERAVAEASKEAPVEELRPHHGEGEQHEAKQGEGKQKGKGKVAALFGPSDEAMEALAKVSADAIAPLLDELRTEKQAALDANKEDHKRSLHIGNQVYHRAGDLPGAAVDARSASEMMESRGYHTSLRVDLTGAALAEAIEAFLASLDEGDEAVLSFAGHGSGPGSKGGEGLIGVDGVVLEYRTLYAMVAAAKGRGAQVELLLDCCHAGLMQDLTGEGLDATRGAVDKDTRSQRLRLYRDELRALAASCDGHRAGGPYHAHQGELFVRSAVDRLADMIVELNDLLGQAITMDADSVRAKGLAAVAHGVRWLLVRVSAAYDASYGVQAQVLRPPTA